MDNNEVNSISIQSEESTPTTEEVITELPYERTCSDVNGDLPSEENTKSAKIVYCVKPIDNGCGITLVGDITNNSGEDLMNRTLEFKLLKDGELVESKEIIITNKQEVNTTSISAFPMNSKLTDFNEIQINLKD